MTTIYAALADVMRDVDHVSKKDRNEHQRFLFRGIDAVVNAVGPALRKHGVIVVPEVVGVEYEQVTTTQNKPANACRVRVSYTFWGPAGDYIRTCVVGEAWDMGDKATPKAMSVAFRTVLLQALALPTDEPDPDSQTYERGQASSPPAAATKTQLEQIGGLLTELGYTAATDQYPFITSIIGRTITAATDLTYTEAGRLIPELTKRLEHKP